MPDAENSDVEVVRWIEDPTAVEYSTTDPDSMQPAAPRHGTPRAGLWRRVITTGHEALASSSEAIAVQVDTVAERMIATLDRCHTESRTARTQAGLPQPGWDVDEIEVSFGVQLTGQATVAIFAGSTQTSAQIVLRFTRTGAAGSSPSPAP